MSRALLCLAAGSVSLCLGATNAHSDRLRTVNLYGGAYGTASHVFDTEGVPGAGFGPGGGLLFGVRTKWKFALEFNFGYTKHAEAFYVDESGTSAFILSSDLLVLPFSGKTQPFVQVGAGLVVGPGATAFNLGGGIDRWVSKHWSVGVRGLFRPLRYTDNDRTVRKVRASSLVFHLVFTYHLMPRPSAQWVRVPY